MDRVPTLAALQVRNCYFDDTSCGFCDDSVETIEHILCSCRLAVEVWQMISNWAKCGPLIFFSFKDVVELHKCTRFGKQARKVFKGIVWVTCWCIWKARNDKKFHGTEVCPLKIVQSIKSIGFLWYSYRSNRKLSWEDWCNFNIG